MLLGWITPLAVVAGLGTSTGVEPGPNAELPTPLVTQRTTFAIPFSVPSAATPAASPVQVVLLLSRDLGATWNVHGQAAPEQGHFIFQAGGEGEYWFSIQSRDRAGNAWPRFTGVPGLRVRVDTTPPAVRVSAWRGAGGEVTARWRIDDANFRAHGVALAYRSAGEPEWHDVALGSQHQSTSGDAYQGEVTWWPDPDPRALEVRVVAVDLAANRSVATATAEPAEPSAPDRWTSSTSTSEAPPTATQAAAAPPAAAPSTGGPSTGVSEAASPEAAGQEATTYGQPWPAQPHPSLGSQYRAEPANEQPAAVPDAPNPGEGRPVNSRLFELEFDVDSVDPSTISHVELWSTRDRGRTWRSVSLHQSSRSPILAKADEEGLYGFRIVVHTRAGAGRKPQPGDPPDIWVRVDLTKPVVRIVNAVEGTGAEANHLIITWTAADAQLAEDPISLAYAKQVGGPWTPIARQLPNTGRYAWPLPDGNLGPVYLRLEARDAAGNMAEFETSQPVVVDRGPPKVHIREVRPLGDHANRPGPRRYIFR